MQCNAWQSPPTFSRVGSLWSWSQAHSAVQQHKSSLSYSGFQISGGFRNHHFNPVTNWCHFTFDCCIPLFRISGVSVTSQLRSCPWKFTLFTGKFVNYINEWRLKKFYLSISAVDEGTPPSSASWSSSLRTSSPAMSRSQARAPRTPPAGWRSRWWAASSSTARRMATDTLTPTPSSRRSSLESLPPWAKITHAEEVKAPVIWHGGKLLGRRMIKLSKADSTVDHLWCDLTFKYFKDVKAGVNINKWKNPPLCFL